MKTILKIYLYHLLAILYASEFDSLSYYDRFDMAVQSYKEGRFRLAEDRFLSILSKDREYRDPAAQLMLGKAQYNQGKFHEALRSGKSVLTNYFQSPYDMHANYLIGDIALSRGKYTQAFEAYLSIRSSVKDSSFMDDLENRLLTCIALGLKEDKIEGIMFREQNEINKSILNIVRSYISWKNGDNYGLVSSIELVDSTLIPDSFYDIYKSLKYYQNSQLFNQNTIAVVLPLSGIEKDKGLSYLLGLSDLFDEPNIINSIRFLIFDTGGNNIDALKAIKSITSDLNIICVLGPLLDDEVLAISELAGSLAILAPKSGSSDLAAISNNLFFLSPSHNIIARRTAQIMVKEMSLKNIAILSPAYGKYKYMTEQFIDELFQLGIDPVIVEVYHEKPENIRRQFKSIRKTAWSLIPEKNPDEGSMNMAIDSLDALFDVDVDDFLDVPEEEKKMTRKDSNQVILETIDGFYIPIAEDELIYVGTQLPLYNLKTILFGNENWLNMEQLNQKLIGPHVQGMHIVSDVSKPTSNSDVDNYTNFYALAFDHGNFLQSILGNSIINRRLFIQNLRNQTGYDGQHTHIQFSGINNNENGTVQILKYQRNRLMKLGIYDGLNYKKYSE